MVALKFYRELLIIAHHSGNVLNSRVGIVSHIALHVLAELQYVEVAGRIE